MSTPSSGSKKKPSKKQHEAVSNLGLFFEPVGEGDMFVRNVG
jgi:hypothetical protein